MKKLSFVVPVLLIALAGCDQTMGGQPYQAEPAMAQQVQRGRITHVRTVQLQGTNQNDQVAGAVLGGLAGGIIGNQFGRGSGNGVMTGLGAIGGAALGANYVGSDPNRGGRLAQQWTVRLDNGNTIQVLQNDSNLYVGEHVRVVTTSNGVRLEP